MEKNQNEMSIKIRPRYVAFLCRLIRQNRQTRRRLRLEHGGHLELIRMVRVSPSFAVQRASTLSVTVQDRDDFVHVVGDQRIDRQSRTNEAGLAHVIEQVKERIPKSLQVQEEDWLVAPADLLPGQLFDHFFECAAATGQCHESISVVEEVHLAVVEILRHLEIHALNIRLLLFYE